LARVSTTLCFTECESEKKEKSVKIEQEWVFTSHVCENSSILLILIQPGQFVQRIHRTLKVLMHLDEVIYIPRTVKIHHISLEAAVSLKI
jgi:hypothetical protein